MFAELKLNQEGKHRLVRENQELKLRLSFFWDPCHMKSPEKASSLGMTHAVNQNNNSNENSSEDLLSTSCAMCQARNTVSSVTSFDPEITPRAKCRGSLLQDKG